MCTAFPWVAAIAAEDCETSGPGWLVSVHGGRKLTGNIVLENRQRARCEGKVP